MRIAVLAAAALLLLSSTATVAEQGAKIDELVQPLIDGEALVGCVVGFMDGDRQEVIRRPSSSTKWWTRRSRSSRTTMA